MMRPQPQALLAAAVLAPAVAACGGTSVTPEPTPERTPTLDERIADYVETYGGPESQYRVILTLDECENLGRLGLAQQETLDRLDDAGPSDPEWRQATGYLGAILERIEEIDCPESIPVP